MDNRTYQSQGSTSIDGTLRKSKGRTNDPDATVFQLDPDKSHSLSFVAVDQNILHLLDTNNSLTVGHSGASYTLSGDRGTANSSRGPLTTNHAFIEKNVPADVTFVGRSPCQEIAKELNRAVPADCAKLKWLLQLHRDPQTLAPTTYQLKGTLYRDDVREKEHPREGKWQVIKGTKTNPNAVIYRLDAFGSDGPILLLKADDGILFFLANDGSLLIGNKHFSYTLNRVNQKVTQLGR